MVSSLHQFHHQRALFDAVDLRDVGMIERCQHLGFALEAGDALGVVGEGLRQHLNGDLALQFGVGGAVDGTHTALAELGDNSVVSDRFLRHHPSAISGWYHFPPG